MHRELLWALPAAAEEVRAWRGIAAAIPDAELRRNALSSLANKRGHTDGAALFGILPRRRDPALLRLLTAYEIIWDYLDSTNEAGIAAGQRNGRQLHLALVDAADPTRPISDYYRHHPWSGDGGYLCALVEACRSCCRVLAGYEHVRGLVVREAMRAQVLAINHDPDPDRRDAGLRRWAEAEFSSDDVEAELSSDDGMLWFELSGAASASLTIHALLALSADERCRPADVAGSQRAYFPWISAATTMLDSYVDRFEDTANGDHSYVAHYRSPAVAAERVRELIDGSLREARALRGGEQHILIVACMVAMYLSKDSAWNTSSRTATRSLIAAGGSLTKLLFPILRLWRIAYGQQSK